MRHDVWRGKDFNFSIRGTITLGIFIFCRNIIDGTLNNFPFICRR